MLLFSGIAAARGSMNNAHSDEEKRHRCLVPLCRLRLCEISPFLVMAAIGDVWSALTSSLRTFKFL